MADDFSGLVSGDYGATGNWLSANVPGTGANETANISGSSQGILSGLDRSANNILDELIVHDTMLGGVGNNAADPLVIDALRLTFDGRGNSYFFKGNYTDVMILGTSAQKLSLNDGGGGAETIGDVWVHGPTQVTIESSAEFDQLFTGPDAGAIAIDASVTATDMVIGGGTVTSKASITAIVNAGKLVLDGSGAGTITVRSGGTLELLTDATVTAITLEPGATLITKNNEHLPTITTLNEYFGSTHDLDTEQQRASIGTRNRFGFPNPLT